MGSPLVETFVKSGFRMSTTDSFVLCLLTDAQYILLWIFVDDLAFASNSASLLDLFKDKVSLTVDVRFFDDQESFIAREVIQTANTISICQTKFID